MSFFASQPIYLEDKTQEIDGITIFSLEDLLEKSQASEAFKEAVRRFREGEKSDLIRYSPGSPPVKVMRVLMKLLEAHPELAIESVTIEAVSGCSTYRGRITVEPQNRTFEFIWDCAWRAQQNQVKNAWGFLDQATAAQRFGYQCFRYFKEVAA